MRSTRRLSSPAITDLLSTETKSTCSEFKSTTAALWSRTGELLKDSREAINRKIYQESESTPAPEGGYSCSEWWLTFGATCFTCGCLPKPIAYWSFVVVVNGAIGIGAVVATPFTGGYDGYLLTRSQCCPPDQKPTETTALITSPRLSNV